MVPLSSTHAGFCEHKRDMTFSINNLIRVSSRRRLILCKIRADFFELDRHPPFCTLNKRFFKSNPLLYITSHPHSIVSPLFFFGGFSEMRGHIRREVAGKGTNPSFLFHTDDDEETCVPHHHVVCDLRRLPRSETIYPVHNSMCAICSSLHLSYTLRSPLPKGKRPLSTWLGPQYRATIATTTTAPGPWVTRPRISLSIVNPLLYTKQGRHEVNCTFPSSSFLLHPSHSLWILQTAFPKPHKQISVSKRRKVGGKQA